MAIFFIFLHYCVTVTTLRLCALVFLRVVPSLHLMHIAKLLQIKNVDLQITCIDASIILAYCIINTRWNYILTWIVVLHSCTSVQLRLLWLALALIKFLQGYLLSIIKLYVHFDRKIKKYNLYFWNLGSIQSILLLLLRTSLYSTNCVTLLSRYCCAKNYIPFVRKNILGATESNS